MRKYFTIIKMVLVGILLSVNIAYSVEFIPVINAQVLGGKYSFDGESGSNGVIANFDFVEGIKFSNEVSMLASYYGNYKGTKDAQELAGGDTLFQESMSNAVVLKLIKHVGFFKIKPKVSYYKELINETKDESWGDGLFDFDKISVGVEIEKEFIARKLLKLRFGFDYYTIEFPNYESLDAKYGSELATTSGIGDKVLDFKTNEIYVQTDWRLSPVLYSKINYYLAQKSFDDQKLVTKSATYEDELRNDSSNTFIMNISRPFNKSVIGLDFIIRSYGSNQDHYDATYLQFVPDYYDYSEYLVGPSYTLRFGNSDNPSQIYLGYSIRTRNYKGRLKQDADGTYTDNKIDVKSNVISLMAVKPISQYFSLKAKIYNENQTSNMDYEQTYSYNYKANTFFLGISYAY